MSPNQLPILFLLLLASACEREDRRLREVGPAVQRSGGVVMSALKPGVPPPPLSSPGTYEENAYAISEGYRLYQAFNCVGCHANGGGGMGPALMDSFWIYGSAPENIFATIVEGRPNGMPSFRHKIPDYQVWQLVAYVRSLSGNVSREAIPGRGDDMSLQQTGTLTPEQTPQPGKR